MDYTQLEIYAGNLFMAAHAGVYVSYETTKETMRSQYFKLFTLCSLCYILNVCLNH